MKPSNLQLGKCLFLVVFRAKVLNLMQGLSLNDKSERHAKCLHSTFPHGKVFLSIWQTYVLFESLY